MKTNSFLLLNVCIFPLDIRPPTFGVTCPSGPLLAYAERDKLSALVNWTKPVAIDNSGMAPTITSNYQSPQRFSQGSHVITYTAVDESANNATCSFTIVVKGNKRNLRFLFCISFFSIPV